MWFLPDHLHSLNHVCVIFVSICIGRYIVYCFLETPYDAGRRFFRQHENHFDALNRDSEGNTKIQRILTSEHIDMIAMRKWKDLLVWIVFHPDELLCIDKRNQTVLHHACLFRAPAQIIQMLLYQKPELAHIQNIDDELPLHWAIRLSAPNEVIKLLLSVNPSSACCIKDKDGNTALSMVWERCEPSLFDSWWRTGQQSIFAHSGWSTITFFLQCYSYSLNMVHDKSLCWDDDSTAHLLQIEELRIDFQPIHLATRCPSCPLTLYTFLLRVYNDDVLKVDNHGRLPLAVACMNPISNRSIGVLTKIHLLLAEHPSAAQVVDRQGRLPLFVALETSLTWNEGIDRLIASYPKSLLLCDPVTRLPAYLSAAVRSQSKQNSKGPSEATSANQQQESWDEAHLSTIYSIFRKDPAQISVTSRCLHR